MDAQRLLASIALACCRHLGQLLVSRVQSILCFWEGVPKPISKVYYITWLLQIRLQILSWSRKGLENTFTGTQQHEPRLLSSTDTAGVLGAACATRPSSLAMLPAPGKRQVCVKFLGHKPLIFIDWRNGKFHEMKLPETS